MDNSRARAAYDRIKQVMVFGALRSWLKIEREKYKKRMFWFGWFYRIRDWAKKAKCECTFWLRTQCYGWRIKKIYFENGIYRSDYCRIIIELVPNLSGRVLGYKKDLKGFYGKPGDWKRLMGNVKEGDISPGFNLKLNSIYNTHRLSL